ncbi:MAG TPA: hypothetical protein VFB38_18370 [Chthonomonadaceae bacterium]|nr:hypothetical protein [Chthonomonadaceae bacterium]
MHQAQQAALTLPTQPTNFSPSRAAYWRMGAGCASRCSGRIWRRPAAFASASAISRVVTRTMDTGSGTLWICASLWTMNASVPINR